MMEDGALYQALHRLEPKGFIEAEWGTSENNRRARYYVITRAGEKQLVAQTEYWERLAAVMGRVLASERSEG